VSPDPRASRSGRLRQTKSDHAIYAPAAYGLEYEFNLEFNRSDTAGLREAMSNSEPNEVSLIHVGNPVDLVEPYSLLSIVEQSLEPDRVIFLLCAGGG